MVNKNNKNCVLKTKQQVHSLKRVFNENRKDININNKKDMQIELNRKSIELNNAQCFTYNICEYCKEKKDFKNKSNTPCADAFKLMRRITKNKQLQLELIPNWNKKSIKEESKIIKKFRRILENV
jgi:hypothetical protein